MMISITIGSTTFSTDVDDYKDALNIFNVVAAREGLTTVQLGRYTFRFGPSQTGIKVIKEIREFTDFGLADAKCAYEHGTFQYDCSYAEADALCARLKAAGCTNISHTRS